MGQANHLTRRSTIIEFHPPFSHFPVCQSDIPDWADSIISDPVFDAPFDTCSFNNDLPPPWDDNYIVPIIQCRIQPHPTLAGVLEIHRLQAA